MIEQSALLVVDMQRAIRLDHPPAHDLDHVVARLNDVIVALRSRHRPVLFIRHADQDGSWQAEGEGWPILPELLLAPSDAIIDKISCDAFRQTRLKDVLAAFDVRSLLIGGYATEFCVDTTIRSAASHGYAVTALSDAHTTRDRPHLDARAITAHHNWVWSGLANPGAPVRVLSTEDLLSALPSSQASPGSPAQA